MDLPVEELGLGVRATNCLENAGIQTVGQLVSLTEWELLRIRNFGRKTLGEIKHALQEVGLSLGMHDVQTGAVGGVRAQARPPAYVGTLAARPVSDLEIGVRTTKWLESNDIRTIGQLASFREWELLQIRNFGRKMLGEIKCALQEVGLSLGLRELGAPGEVDARAAAGASSGSLGTISEWLVADLGLGVRATNCLENAGVLTVGQLVSCTEWEVIEMDSVGRKTLQEIKNALREFGLSLGMRTAAP